MTNGNGVNLTPLPTNTSATSRSAIVSQEEMPSTNEQCRSCGVILTHDFGDGLCQTCFLTHGLDVVVELLNGQVQVSLFQSLMVLSHQAQQREQTDAAYHALSAAYHAAYQPPHVDAIIREAQRRIATWKDVFDECGEVRLADYERLMEEAQQLREDMDAVNPII